MGVDFVYDMDALATQLEQGLSDDACIAVLDAQSVEPETGKLQFQVDAMGYLVTQQKGRYNMTVIAVPQADTAFFILPKALLQETELEKKLPSNPFILYITLTRGDDDLAIFSLELLESRKAKDNKDMVKEFLDAFVNSLVPRGGEVIYRSPN